MSSKRSFSKKVHSLAAFVFVFLFVFVQYTTFAQAAELVNRSIFVSSSYINEIVTHTYSFSTAGPSTIGSISFEYCTNTPVHDLPCTAPAGLDVSGFGINVQAGITGFAPSGSTTANHLIITRGAALEPGTPATYTFGNIMNPSTAREIVYVRISVFDGPDATGTRVDRGSVVFVTQDPVTVSAFVPPYLTFCVGVTVALDCSSTVGAFVNLGELSPVNPTVATTQFSVATNDPDGYNTFLNGQTMTAGNNIIPALGVQTPSAPGTSQFGVNLRSNTVPSVGADPDIGAVASGVPDARYNAANFFRFVNGDRIAGSSLSTGFNRYTVSYLVNVSNDQPPGIYAATLTYTAIATF